MILILLAAIEWGVIADVAAHPNINALAFALTSSGIYRTTDGGAHWTRVSDAGLYTIPFAPVHAIAFNPFNDRDLCILGDSSMSCSADLGATWTPFPQPGGTFLLFDPTLPDRMFMGPPYGTDWVYVSADHGRTWLARGSLDGHPWFHGSAAVDPRSGALFENGSPHGGCIPVCSLFRSDDAGMSWREIAAQEDAWMLAGSVLYVITSGSLAASTNLGLTFETRGRVPVAVSALASHSKNSAAIYAAGDGGALFQSVDGGRTWRRFDQEDIGERIAHISVGADGAIYIATQSRILATPAGKRRRAAAH